MSGNRTAVSSTRKSEMPSTPRYQCTPSAAAGVVVVRHQLEAAVVHLHDDQRRDGEAERHERGDQGDGVRELLGHPLVEAEQAEHGGADGRQEDEQRQVRDVVCVMPTTSGST